MRYEDILFLKNNLVDMLKYGLAQAKHENAEKST